MPVAQPQHGHQDLPPDAHRVLLAGSIEGLHFPKLCPDCGAVAADPLSITKVFMYNHHDDSGWRYRVATATPLFCRTCISHHRAQALPVTSIDRLKSLIFTELAIPAFGLSAFGLFLLKETAPHIIRNVQLEWPLLAIIGLFFLLAILCLRTAWQNNAHRRLPVQTQISRAFDFGDNDTSMYQTTSRTYAIRDAGYARQFEQLNAERSAALLGPEQKRRERKAFWITAAIVATVALVAHYIRFR